jgi:conjugative relaxase-like TrwC/TraI family protein
MLRYHTSKSAHGVKTYFDTADYYAKGSETIGCWYGKLAAELGLHGQVTREAFHQMCDNINPKTGKSLTPRTKENRRVGDDMVFSLLKDVGAYIMLLPPEERDAMLAVVGKRAYEVMGVIEADVQTRVRKNGAFENRPGYGLAVAGFLHTTARPVRGKPPDPHPHWHMFAFNATKDPEECRIKAADMANIYRDKAFYEALFFSLVAQDFRGLNRPIERRPNGKWGMAGLASLGDTFSKRRDEVNEEARLLNITDPGRKSMLAATTRAKKDRTMTPEQLRNEWYDQLTDEQRDGLTAVQLGKLAQAPEVTVEEAVAFAVEHCFDQYSVVPERELLRVALQHGLGCVTLEQIAAELPRHGVFIKELDGRRMATTDALQAEEDDMARFAADGRFTVDPVGVDSALDRQLDDGKSLSDEQWRVVTGLLESEDKVSVVEGPAGSGKSSLLGKLREGMKLKGHDVTWLGTTAKAAEVLEKDGFDAHTVARFLVDQDMQNAAVAAGGHVVCDEASMLGHKDARKLFSLAQQLKLRLTFVGDPRQHGAVPRGAFLHVLKAYGGITPFRVTKIIRQENPRYREAAQLFSEGKTAEGFDALDELGWVRERDEADIARNVAADYMQAIGDGDSCVVVSPTHAEANAITDAIRAALRIAGKIGPVKDERQFTRLVQVNLSEAERKQAYTYQHGDVLVFHQNAKGYQKGDRITVADPASAPVELADRFGVYRPEKIALAPGDKIAFIGSVKAFGGKATYRNGMPASVEGFTDSGNIRLADGRVIAANAAMFRHGYVSTSFAAQGSTAKRAIVAMSQRSLPAVNQESMYVPATRARQWVRIYTDNKAAVRKAAQISSRKLAALDLGPATPDPLQDWPERLKRILDQRRRVEHQNWLAKQLAAPGLPTPTRPPTSPSSGPPRTHAGREQARQQEREHTHGR